MPLIILGCPGAGSPPEPPSAPPERDGDTWHWCLDDDVEIQSSLDALRQAAGVETCTEIPRAIQDRTSLTLSRMNLSTIDILAEFNHLESLDLSHNKIHDLTPLKSWKKLIYLDVRHNELETIQPISELPLQVLQLNGNPSWTDQLLKTAPVFGFITPPITASFLAHCSESPLFARLLQHPAAPSCGSPPTSVGTSICRTSA